MPGTGPARKIRLGISSCLLGAEVRYDGGHRRDAYITETLAEFFELVPVCPEVAIGLGIPRRPIRLVRREGGLRVVGAYDRALDVTARLEDYGRRMAAELGELGGYIFKRASPSCGMERVKVYSEEGMPVAQARGAYARTFMEARPWLPCEEEGRLGDPMLRAGFIARVLVFERWQRLRREGLTAAELVALHADRRSLRTAYSQTAYRGLLDQLAARAGSGRLEAIAEEFARGLVTALRPSASDQG